MPKIKNIIIFSIIAIAFILIYVFFPKSSPPEANLVSSGTGVTLPNMDGSTNEASIKNTNSLIAKDFLSIFSNIQNIKLDDAIFSDGAFNSLHDSSIVLTPDGTEGRPNPFAQFGNDAVVSTTQTTPPDITTSTKSTTLNPSTPD
ncbi:MAG: hypothetical protein WCW93_00190 [Candidatus Paceibacterota bacterium]